MTGAFRGGDRRGGNDGWLTPRSILDALGDFDLDPCGSPLWPTAKQHLYEADDGLAAPWPADARVWLNPPYSQVARWMERLAKHDNGIALVFARTDTAWFQKYVFARASAVLFLAKRIKFVDPVTLEPAKNSAGSGSCLVAYDPVTYAGDAWGPNYTRLDAVASDSDCPVDCLRRPRLRGRLVTL